MDILVLSDSHGNVFAIEQVLSQLNFRPRAILFLGDGLRDVERLSEREAYRDIPCYAVAGNCDWFAQEPLTRTLTLGGCTIVMMHGHTYDVRYGHSPAVRYAAEQGADVLLYGHTHIPYERTLAAGTPIVESKDGEVVLTKPLVVANPGSIGEPRDGGAPRFGVLTIKDGSVLFSHGSLGD